MIDERNFGYARGAADFLVKPVPKDVLLKTVARHAGPGPILIVEDDAPTREVLRQFLSSSGARILEAENGQAALNVLARQQPALVVLDLMMPVMDGFEVIDRMRSRPEWQGIPVIVCTARDLTQVERARLAGGVAQVIAKDLGHLETLGAAISGCLSRRISQNATA
jgi:CheY-like chemotaxis protein